MDKRDLEVIVDAIEDFMWVETKDQDVKPFFLNKIQGRFVEIFKKVLEVKDKPVRLIILKGRQFGFSTLILALFFIKCVFVKNTRAAVISHDDISTRKLFRRVKFFIATLQIKPVLDKESEREYTFPKTNSYFYIGTAGSKAFGRGDNLTDVHCSEVAFWPNAARVMNGLLQAVGKSGVVIMETTANGVGDYFQKLWKRSWNNSESVWKGLFFKWTKFDEYEMNPGNKFVLTPEEEHLRKLHPELNDRKLAWRRWKIAEIEAEPGQEPLQMFQQEYPLTPREAFISSGKSVFSLRALESYETKEPMDKENGWKIWKKPSGYSVMAIDSSEGLENNDRSVIDIYNEDLEQVAHWAGWCDPDELGKIAVIMAIRYNSFIINEVNNMGIVINSYLRKNYPIVKQYHREKFDKIEKKKIESLGWRTTSITKSKLVGDLQIAIRNHEIEFNNAETVDECMTFIKNGKGGFEAQSGANDDRVITAGLAVQAFKDHPPKKELLNPEYIQTKELEKKNKEWRKKKLKKNKKKNKSI